MRWFAWWTARATACRMRPADERQAVLAKIGQNDLEPVILWIEEILSLFEDTASAQLSVFAPCNPVYHEGAYQHEKEGCENLVISQQIEQWKG